ncbi:hypothetical protein BDV96DRAFT_686740 [Lophiotrema nucula]|uniref:Uncharacterized protein n=1 Tax=Lophiotrema nucula TaxID=690887 RepID=A0A6A5ZDC0_9PLEO|nr:hypothetical protein BDV96DRAFT_686740 [Lophiotrema nucula]
MAWNATTRRKHRHKIGLDPEELRVRDAARQSFLKACCNSDERHHSLTGGLQVVISFSEKRMLAYESTGAKLLELLYTARPQTTTRDRVMDFTANVATIAKSLTPQTCVDDIVTQLYRHYNTDLIDAKPYENVTRNMVFAAIGWSTMLYTAILQEPDSDFCTSTQDLGDAELRVAQSAGRPISALLRNFSLIPVSCPPGIKNSQGLDTLLAVTHLNFFSLTNLCDVSIEWVDDLSKHCEFNRYSQNKSLKLFRFPSFCAEICLNEVNGSLLSRICRGHNCQNDCHALSDTVTEAYMTEVLMTYRLLFGQHRRSC